MDEKKRVILIKGDKTKWYEQAIFIMRSDTAENKIPKDFVAEAEKIIYNYMNRKNMCGVPSSSSVLPPPEAVSSNLKKPKHANTVNLNIILNVIIVLCCILIGIILYAFS